MRQLLPALLCSLLAFPSAGAAAKGDEPAQVMIVGTFHFSNPGHDQHNVQADDVLMPERQNQLQAISKSLQRFHPSVIAVEWPADVVNERYTKFKAGELSPSRNEVVQLGFRLAKDAGIESVYGIDVDGDFPYEPVQAWAQQHGASARLDAAQNRIEAMTKKVTQLQGEGIAKALHYMNQPENIQRDYAFYADLVRFGAGNDQPGAKLLAAWNARNFEICARLVQTLKPGDHAVVFYGSGHSFLLRQCVRQTPGLQLIDADSYLRP